MAKYYVRSFPLHRVLKDAKGNKNTQIFTEGSEVELTEEEYRAAQHLVETEAEYNSRATKAEGKRQGK